MPSLLGCAAVNPGATPSNDAGPGDTAAPADIAPGADAPADVSSPVDRVSFEIGRASCRERV